MSQVAIRVKGVSKKYTIGKQKDGSLRETLSSIFTKKNKTKEDFWALKDVSFDIQKGDVVGIIGKNGAGKSTILKVLSQITRPTEGEIEINGRVASLLEVGTGFHPELTGRENIFLNGTILGMTRKEVASKFDEIVAFSGIEKFIDTPVKHYSSGMYVRLAFAVAAHLEPEILIIDEVLAVGDAEFQKKCLGKMKDVAGEGRTVIFVSHQLGAIKSLCTTGILLDGGKCVKQGLIDDVINEYQRLGLNKQYLSPQCDKKIYLKEVSFKSEENGFKSNEKICLSFRIENNVEMQNADKILIRILDQFDSPVTSFEKSLVKNTFELDINGNFLKKGNYVLNIILYRPALEIYDDVTCCNFEILDNNGNYAHLEMFDSGRIYADESWLS